MLSTLTAFPILIASAFSFVLTFLVARFAKRLKIIDDPKGKTHPKVIHTYPTPRGGGLAIFGGVAAAALLFLPLDKHLLGILAGGLFLTVVGYLDDRFDLNPYLRLFLGFIAASLPIAAGIGISFVSNPLGGGTIDLSQPKIYFDLLGETRSIWVLSDLFALLWIVFMMNILNMGAKGVDGQLPGVVVIAALAIAALSLKFSADVTQWPVIVLAMAVSGAFLGFLPWNFYPQKVMPGYGGSILAGYFLAILSILATTKVGALVVVLAVPLIDTGYTIARRVLSGKSPVWGDTGHLHHRLLKLGWGKRRVAVFYWGVTLALGILALNLNTHLKFYTMVGISLALGGTILWLTRKRSLP
ncbi:undecaprenyl/decaprenyl-phosphate alpha-N-acetylglucosaminyl 1-phosphate transferase [Candidatus Woesebacteria bacterium]|nr:undecaprenyl/decaprenyl-phosphate alpha-N-acetylglucosaminyl 1-phosphate transferase [Candidatus Woesebacteria bacterium]